MDLSQRQVLAEAVGKVRGRIERLRERGESVTEQDTKRILIEPVLAALGWRLEDLDDVRSEYRRKPQDNPVDYALLVYGEPCLFVEAKTLSNVLDRRKCASQVLGYASVVGVGWCLVTNGDEYRLYNSHASVDVEEKLFRTVRLSDAGQQEECLETLGLLAKDQMGEKALEILWKGEFIDRKVKAAVTELFCGDESSFARLVHKKTSDLTSGEVKESLKRAKLSVDFPSISAVLPHASAVERSLVVPAPPKARLTADGGRVKMADLVAAGLIQPPLVLETTYKKVRLEAIVDTSGAVVFAGQPYDTPSLAGGAARGSVVGSPLGGPYPATNGWRFWQFRDPGSGELREVDELRQRYLAASGQRSQ